MTKKYYDPRNKDDKPKLVFVLDNLAAHKTSYIMRLIQDDYTSLLFTPANTPEFSPIENLFGRTKKIL